LRKQMKLVIRILKEPLKIVTKQMNLKILNTITTTKW